MFNLIAVQDTVSVAPKTFGIDPATTIQDALNKKYANKLIPDRGLALSVFDILTAEDGRVTWGNGQMYYKVSFRLLLFAPFLGEVIVGKVLATTPSYIRVSLGFFQDVYILRSLLPPNTLFDETEKVFFWWPHSEEAMDETQLANTIKGERLYFDPLPIRFRVESIEWHESEPGPPSTRKQPGAVAVNGEEEEEEVVDPYEKAGYRVIATVADAGLGLTNWWAEVEAEVDGEADADADAEGDMEAEGEVYDEYAEYEEYEEYEGDEKEEM